jgi:hypothetical protein
MKDICPTVHHIEPELVRQCLQADLIHTRESAGRGQWIYHRIDDHILNSMWCRSWSKPCRVPRLPFWRLVFLDG